MSLEFVGISLPDGQIHRNLKDFHGILTSFLGTARILMAFCSESSRIRIARMLLNLCVPGSPYLVGNSLYMTINYYIQ